MCACVCLRSLVSFLPHDSISWASNTDGCWRGRKRKQQTMRIVTIHRSSSKFGWDIDILEALDYLLLWHESCCFNLIHTIFYSLLLFNDKTGCEYVYTCLTSNVFFLIDEENKRRWWRRRKKKKEPQKVSRLRTMQTHTHTHIYIYIYLSTRRTKKKKKRVSWSD